MSRQTTGQSHEATRPARAGGRRQLPLPALKRRRRFLRISWYFIRLMLHIAWWDLFLARTRMLGWYATHSRPRRFRRSARRFRRLAAELGGVMIKLGQFASSRVDLLPMEVILELSGLQDEVPPVRYPYIKEAIERELGPLEGVFRSFAHQPVAAASLGQVHFATLLDGRAVAVKVQRPRIETIVEVDLDALAWVVSWLTLYKPLRRRADLVALIEEFSKVTRAELDYTAEARNAELFRQQFADNQSLVVPRAYPELTTRRVLLMERIQGIKITNYPELLRSGVDRLEIAERLYQLYLEQIFVHGFFHADPHPGNIFIAPSASRDTSQWKLILIDFGMMGQVSSSLMADLREGLIGVIFNDPERIVSSMERVGIILPGADHQQIVQGVQIMMRYSYNRTLNELSKIDVNSVASELRELIFQMPFQLPQQLIFLGRAVGVVSGICTGLAPSFNVFKTAQPFVREMIRQERSGRQLLERLQREAMDLGTLMLKLPRKVDTVFNTLLYGEFQVRPNMVRLERRLARLERMIARLAGGIVSIGLFLGGVALETSGRSATVVWGLAVIFAIWTLWPRPDWGW